jgi:hypothetical protein
MSGEKAKPALIAPGVGGVLFVILFFVLHTWPDIKKNMERRNEDPIEKIQKKWEEERKRESEIIGKTLDLHQPPHE